MGFGVWTPDVGKVAVCWLGPPTLEIAASLDSFVRSLRPEIALSWVDTLEHVVAIDRTGDRP